MKKKQLTAVLCLLLFVTSFFIGCASETSLNSNQNETKVKLEERKVLVKEAIENAEADFQEAKLKYKNLEMENIRPYCTNVTTVSDVEYYFLKNYKGITDSLEMYHELLNVLHQLVGENLNEEYFINIFCDEIRPECKYNNFAEYKKALFSGEEKEVCDLSYMSDEEDEDYIFVELQKELAFIYFNKGIIYDSIPSEIKNSTEFQGAKRAKYLCEKVKTYFVNNLDCNLDDSYQLKNGKMSICDSISFVEDFLNSKTGVEGNEDLKLKVTAVEVYKVSDECYCYRYRITRELLGLTKVCIDSGTLMNDRGLDYDISEAYIIDTNDVDVYVGRSRLFNYKKMNEMERIIPLSEAVRIISESIGENSIYKVKNISLGYMDKSVGQDDVQGRMYASWIFECGNLQDSLDTVFYVNVDTGEITVQY